MPGFDADPKFGKFPVSEDERRCHPPVEWYLDAATRGHYGIIIDNRN